jgi:AraC family transcriptional regulator of adaptative response/methylated-DNA-[protein]-cysteine methyltransferase
MSIAETEIPPEIDSEAYLRVAAAIHYLAMHYAAQPSLDDTARVAGYSPSHFQRVFTRLAGVSPKAFVGALTLEHAKASLAKGRSVLDASLGAGLSAPSRLHDLSLKIEAMTPGDYARGGEGLRVAFGFYPSLFGPALFAAIGKGLCALAFADEGEEDAALADIISRWPRARFERNDAEVAPYAKAILLDRTSVPLQLFGTPWQIKVWQALLSIPEGRVTSYQTIAEACAMPNAARAAGTAIGRNPVSYLIPCHRVLAGNGAITGYHWGVSRKRAMLALEAARGATLR